MKGHKDSDGRFHPHTKYKKGVRKARDQSAKTQGVRYKKMTVTKSVKLPDVNLRQKYWGFSVEDGKVSNLVLGNLTDAGWYWSGDKDDLNTFMVRIAKSNESNQFMEEMMDVGISFNMLKPHMLMNLKGKLTDDNDDGLYALLGDNSRWKFNEDDESVDVSSEFEYAVSDLGLKENQKNEFSEEFWDHYTGIDYEEFLKERGEGFRKRMIEAIEQASNYDDYFEEIEKIAGFPYGEVEEDFREFQNQKIAEATNEAVDAIKAREGKEGTQI